MLSSDVCSPWIRTMNARRSLLAALLLAAALPFMSLATAQTAAPSADPKKKEALEWLDRFSRYQVLFHAEDMKKLRQRVEAMSPEEAAAWWEKTAPQRQLLSSSQWRETE